MKFIDEIEKKQIREKAGNFKVGDTVKVFYRIKEGDKERIQPFEGIVIKRQREGVRETFTVRKIVQSVGVERTFPVHSPRIDHIEVLRSAKVRRAKLYYLRKAVGSAATRLAEEKTKEPKS